ncbi:putative permease YjgP/YjgQ family protein [compost metagenome]
MDVLRTLMIPQGHRKTLIAFGGLLVVLGILLLCDAVPAIASPPTPMPSAEPMGDFAQPRHLAPLLPQEARGSAHQQVAAWMRWATPTAPFFAALIAAPMGMLFSRKGAYAGAALSILLVFIYYVLIQVCRALGEHGTLSPFVAAWTPNLLFGLTGVFLIWWADRR